MRPAEDVGADTLNGIAHRLPVAAMAAAAAAIGRGAELPARNDGKRFFLERVPAHQASRLVAAGWVPCLAHGRFVFVPKREQRS